MLGINWKRIEDKHRIFMPVYKSMVHPHFAYCLTPAFSKGSQKGNNDDHRNREISIKRKLSKVDSLYT